jgi:DNA invertase Pin-like site-specific DNA recombinase
VTAAAYLRRSVSKDPTKEVSREAQEAACRRMVGGTPLTLYVDWNISGGSTRGRPEYQRLRADVEAGTVTAVYAYSISRLARSARELLDFLEACKAHGVTVTTDAEGSLGGRGAFAKFQHLLMAGIAEMERDLASERTLAAHAVRRERGDHIGPAPYGMRLEDRETARAAGHARGLVLDPSEDFGAVVAAYQETHNLQATCRLLNLRAIPTKSGRPWRESSVRGMLRARAPEILPRVKGTRAGGRAYLLSGLLRCPHDDSTLMAKANHGRWVSYGCRIARDAASHPRPWNIAEGKVLPAIRDEAAHLRPIDPATGEPVDAVTLTADNAAQRDALAGRLERAAEMYVLGPDKGGWTRERHAAEVTAVTAELGRLGDAETVVAIPAIDWTEDPRSINATLRAIFDRVKLGPDLRPLPWPEGFAWTMPAWRAP